MEVWTFFCKLFHLKPFLEVNNYKFVESLPPGMSGTSEVNLIKSDGVEKPLFLFITFFPSGSLVLTSLLYHLLIFYEVRKTNARDASLGKVSAIKAMFILLNIFTIRRIVLVNNVSSYLRMMSYKLRKCPEGYLNFKM